MAQLTKKAIVNSFIKLLNKKPLDKITVKDIVEDCGINRNTFYYHFADIKELTIYTFNTRMTEAVDTDASDESWGENFINMAKFALENKKAVYHIYNSVNREELQKYFNAIAYKAVSGFVRRRAVGTGASEEDIELITEFYKGALTGMVFTWLEKGMIGEPEVIIRRLGKLMDGAIKRSLEISAQDKK